MAWHAHGMEPSAWSPRSTGTAFSLSKLGRVYQFQLQDNEPLTIIIIMVIVVLSAPRPTCGLGVHHLTVFVSPCDRRIICCTRVMATTSLKKNTPSTMVNGKAKGCSTAHSSSSAGAVHVVYSLTTTCQNWEQVPSHESHRERSVHMPSTWKGD